MGELQDKPNDVASTSNGTAVKLHKVIAPAKIVLDHTKKSDAAVAKEYMNSFMNNIKMKESSKKQRDNSDDELLDSLLKSIFSVLIFRLSVYAEITIQGVKIVIKLFVNL